ncbi:MAG: DUF541 domain-containing protein [Gemmatimonadetes bacterium]|nr:DUF541 domain-containing protein [Gemmatimonadota bacterium]MYA23279.1 DUF541 domain-containing protein [Gemmatimonadota bacterium]MYB67704.1 DUF541 domain-containing protein [Gemmatimonadota bacterium]
MKRCNYWFLTVGALLILTLTACDVNIASEVLSSSATDRTIHVTGSGSVTGEPDIATLDIGVSVERETVAEAREEAASAMTALINSLQANDVAKKDIKTENFSIYPQYDYTDDGRVLRGYRVNNTVRAKVRDLATLSDVIDGAAGAGGDSIVINSIQFMIDDTTPLQTQARSLAVKDAEAKAQTLAKASGVRLGEPITITESTYFEGPPIPFATAEADFDDAARTATPIAPGELAVTVTVTAVYEIE